MLRQGRNLPGDPAWVCVSPVRGDAGRIYAANMAVTREAGLLPDLPSVFEPVALREGADALGRAAALAPGRGAGTLPWVRSFSRMEAAVVLEPEQPLAAARLAVLVAGAALAEVLAALGPPELPVALRWPALVTLDGALVGRARLAEPPGAAEGTPPPWIAVGVEARLAFAPGIRPGDAPHLTSLEEQGYGDLGAERLVAAWARSLMAALADWQDEGPGAVVPRILERLGREPWMGEGRRFLDAATGDLLVGRDGERERHALVAALRRAEAP